MSISHSTYQGLWCSLDTGFEQNQKNVSPCETNSQRQVRGKDQWIVISPNEYYVLTRRKRVADHRFGQLFCECVFPQIERNSKQRSTYSNCDLFLWCSVLRKQMTWESARSTGQIKTITRTKPVKLKISQPELLCAFIRWEKQEASEPNLTHMI